MFFTSARAITYLNRFSLPGIAFTLLVGFLASVSAQSGGGVDLMGTGGRHTIQGRIYFPSGRRSDASIKVRLESTASGDLSVLADMNGSFSFRSLTPGSYVIIIDERDYETIRETIYIDTGGIGRTAPRTLTIPIYLQPKRFVNVATRPGVLNAALANVPKPAIDLYQKALESSQAGNSTKAIEELKAALSLYPEFPLALNELGVQYLKRGEPDKAAETLEKAVKLAPDEFSPKLNYGIALLNQKKFTLAEEQLKAALKKNDSAPTAHMYLGIAMISLKRLNEAETELLRAITSGGGEIAIAHRYLGGVYWGKREYKRAADELEMYLKLMPKATDAERTREAIKDLRSKQ